MHKTDLAIDKKENVQKKYVVDICPWEPNLTLKLSK